MGKNHIWLIPPSLLTTIEAMVRQKWLNVKRSAPMKFYGLNNFCIVYFLVCIFGKLTMLKSIKGFNDILHIETESTRPSSEWRQLESSLIDVLNQFGFEQIRSQSLKKPSYLPVRLAMPPDIVEKEMYSFYDKSNPPTALTLCLKARQARYVPWWSITYCAVTIQNFGTLVLCFAMNNRKRPLSSVSPIRVESFGSELADADAELIIMTYQMWQNWVF